MRQASATSVAENFSEFLGEVEHGQSIQVLKNGRAVARLVPDCDFLPGRSAAQIFCGRVGDVATADAIEAELMKVKQSEEAALAH